MLNLTYLKPKNDLPNPKGPLSLSIPSQAIALANHDVAANAWNATTDKSNNCGQFMLLLSILLPDKHGITIGNLEYSRVF